MNLPFPARYSNTMRKDLPLFWAVYLDFDWWLWINFYRVRRHYRNALRLARIAYKRRNR